jgi:hypothetical protein
MAEQRNFFPECYSGDVAKSMTPDGFKQTFCLACRNLQCSNAKVNESRWMQRMLVQEDVLLRNPRFADKDDPLFRELQAHDFKDKVREALAIEISSQKGDWSIPTAAEVESLASKIAGFVPAPSEEPPPAQEWVLRGDTPGSRYVVKEQAGSWLCTCKGFDYYKTCKHILDVQQKILKAPPPSVVQPAGEENKNLKAPDSSGWYQAQEKNLVPKTLNTRVPPEGVLIGHPRDNPVREEPADPWAPPKKEIVIPVGGKIVMGGKREP